MGDLTTDLGDNIAVTTSRLRNVSLFDGKIQAQRLKAVAEAVFAPTGGVASSNGSFFVGLRVLGTDVPTSVPPNTKVPLDGIGYVIVKEEELTSGPTGARAKVNMLRVHVDTANSYNIPVGTDIVIGSAKSTARPYR